VLSVQNEGKEGSVVFWEGGATGENSFPVKGSLRG